MLTFLSVKVNQSIEVVTKFARYLHIMTFLGKLRYIQGINEMKQKILTFGLLAIGIVGLVGTAPAASALDCSVLPQDICGAAGNGEVGESGIWMLLIWVLNAMIALVGIAATGAIIYAGILYSSAGGNSENVAKSKTIIANTAIGIVAFGLMYLGLNWLIPGGIFN